MHKYSIKIHYGKICSGYIQTCWVGLWEKRTGEETVVTEFFKARKQKEGEGE